MTIRLYNTLSRRKETFMPRDPGFVGMYLCGPTVYSDAHLGHAKTAVAFDVVRRWLMQHGYHVRFVSNVTDVGHITESLEDEGRDRIGERAKLERVEPLELADRYFWRYFDDMGRLGVLRPDVTPRATGHIIEQIELTERLLEHGFAYEASGSVYFRVSQWDAYGKLSGRNIEELESGTREMVRDEKEDPRDFALWKHADPEHVQRWASPWGEGFPGWHIECSAMALKYLGPGFDIHAGGLDLVFPHHEAEIAQAEAAGFAFARYWMHGNLLTVGGEKMSKSKGNFITLAEFLRSEDPMVLRFLLVSSHYRSVSEVSSEAMRAAESGLARLREAFNELGRRYETAPEEHPARLTQAIEVVRASFAEAMNDDFNTPEALAALFTFTREVNAVLSEQDANPSRFELELAMSVYREFAEGVLGLRLTEEEHTAVVLDELVQIALEARQAYRLARDFARADALRERLERAGIVLEDTPAGTRWKRG